MCDPYLVFCDRVYECNSRCQCRQRCSNSVVQAGISHRLQLFHTGNPQLNWGLRTLDDIPMGTFVCSYLGHVYTEMGAEKVQGRKESV